MSSLTGRKPKDTYPWLLQAGAAGPLTGTPRPICLGDGTATPLSVTTRAIYEGTRKVAVVGDVGATGYQAPLAIPTPDGYPKITHPSVVHIPGGLGDYCYWMAYTPFPGADREDPNIVCSHDGVNWIQHPDASTTAILPAGWKAAQSPVVGWCADTHAVLLPNGSLAVYFAAFRGGTPYYGDVWRSVTTDGVTWSAPVKVVTGDALPNGAKVSSPAVEIDAAGQYWMWTCNDTGKIGSAADNEAGIFYRTSADGITWSSPTACSWPRHCHGHTTIDNMIPWHLDVKLAGGKWHMLLNSHSGSGQNAGRLFYLRSADGINWQGNVAVPCLPLIWSEVPEFFVYGSGANLGKLLERNYRSCFLPVPGEPLAWRCWVTSAGDDITAPTDQSNITWNCVVFDNVILDPYRRQPSALEIARKEQLTARFLMTPTGWRIVASATSPAVITASTLNVLSLQLAGALVSSGCAFPYPSGSGYAPPYVTDAFDRDTLSWRHQYEIAATFTYLSLDIEIYFLLGVKNTYTNATGFVGRQFGFAISNGRIYAVGNTDAATDKINPTYWQDVAPLVIGGGTGVGLKNSITMKVTADGGAELLVNGYAYRVATGMPQAIAASFGDAGNILPAIFVKYRSGATASAPFLYVTSFQAACVHQGYANYVSPIDRLLP